MENTFSLTGLVCCLFDVVRTSGVFKQEHKKTNKMQMPIDQTALLEKENPED